MKLRELEISNYGSIGLKGITIRIDNIVALVGANNAGKSTVLNAYITFATAKSELSEFDFNDKNPNKSVCITGVFTDISDEDKKQIGEKWLFEHHEYGSSIKYRYKWDKPNEKGQKQSWNNDDKAWIDGGMGGWDTKISSCVPKPIHINPYEDPIELQKKIIDILTSAIKNKIKEDKSPLSPLIDEIEKLAEKVKVEIKDNIDGITSLLQERLQDVFPDHKVSFTSQAGEIDPSKIIASGSQLEIEDPNGSKHSLIKQGTGLQRAFLWSALNALADSNQYKMGKKILSNEDPRILLIEEPETFLHPPAIRSAREALYSIAKLENWQVILTTHSPIFIDVSKPHTTIVRLEKLVEIGTKTFATELADFNENERDRLRMIRSCHPSVNEFFFADRIILVEGDTEIALFKKLLDSNDKYHIVNCLGKANIILFQKILNHFGVKYIVIHDTDCPKNIVNGSYRKNSMWTENIKIFNNANGNNIIAHVPDLEQFYFGSLTKSDKPYSALKKIENNDFVNCERANLLINFFEIVAENGHPGIINKVEDYKKLALSYAESNASIDTELWNIED